MAYSRFRRSGNYRRRVRRGVRRYRRRFRRGARRYMRRSMTRRKVADISSSKMRDNMAATPIADGGTHLHAFVDFGRKFRSRRTSIFDVGDHHPNVSATHSSPREGFDYACKDGDIVAGGLGRPEPRNTTERVHRWHDIVSATSREEFFEMLLAHDPRTLCTSFTQLSKYADWRYREDPEPYRSPEGMVVDTSRFPEIEEWSCRTLQSLQHCK